MEFKTFPKIERLDKQTMTITQKIHGSNGCIIIYEYLDQFRDDVEKKIGIIVQSRNRVITPDDDNFGFAKYVDENAAEIIEKLGVGVHFGEWAGPGINSSEGLKEKAFVLFNHWEFNEYRPLPHRMMVVPVLYSGPIDNLMVKESMDDLKLNGSKLVQGFMKVEGVVVQIGNTRYKKTFEVEETKWQGQKKDKSDRTKSTVEPVDVSALLQPIRLEKLLSRDQVYLVTYPKSLGSIVKDYVADLEQEGQLIGSDDDVKLLKKHLGPAVFKFVKETIKL